jgi:hypothetical protein
MAAFCFAAIVSGAAWAKTRKATAAGGVELTPAVFSVNAEQPGDLSGSTITVRLPVQPPSAVRPDLEAFAQATGAVFEDAAETDGMPPAVFTTGLEAAFDWLREKLGIPRSAPLPDELRAAGSLP